MRRFIPQIVIGLIIGEVWLLLVREIHLTNPYYEGEINRSLESSCQQALKANEEVLVQFHQQAEREGQWERVGPYYSKAKAIHSRCLYLIGQLDDWKRRIAAASGGYLDDNLTLLKRPEDKRSVQTLLIGHGGGALITRQLDTLLGFMLNHLGQWTGRKEAYSHLALRYCNYDWPRPGADKYWHARQFDGMTAGSALSVISAFQQDILLSEKTILEYLYAGISGGCGWGNAVAVIAIPLQSYALPGQKVKALIFQAAYDRTMKPVIKANRGSVITQGGVGTWNWKAETLGMHTISGTAGLRTDSGIRNYPWSFQFMVANPPDTLLLEKADVLFRGIPNPVTVLPAAGFDTAAYALSIPGTVVKRYRPGHYLVTIKEKSNHPVTATVELKVSDWWTMQANVRKLRVKDLPPPIPAITGSTAGHLSAAGFQANPSLTFTPRDTDFTIPYRLISYQFSLIRPGIDTITGPISGTTALLTETPAIRAAIHTTSPGDRILITNLKVAGPEGRQLTLPPLSLRLD